MTTKLGSEAGYVLLWLVIAGCAVKVFVQIELARHSLASGRTTLEALDRLPGPRWGVSWALWIWAVMFLAMIVQVSGIAGTLSEVFLLSLPGLSEWLEELAGGSVDGDGALPRAARLWTIFLTLTVIALLLRGRYRVVERVSTVMVFLFTVSTVVAVVRLQWTPYAIESTDLLRGLSFGTSREDGSPVDFTTAFAAFGITGVGASELVYYPYWCLEKGYSRLLGPDDGSARWQEAARGWMRVVRLDAWLSFVVYTVATVAFYLLGAAVLHEQAATVGDDAPIRTLSRIYLTSLGGTGHWLFLGGAFFVLYSTFFVATASNARLLADGLIVFRLARPAPPEDRYPTVRMACVLLPACSLVVFLALGRPVSLVQIGGIAQACMLPVLACLGLWLAYRSKAGALRAGGLWRAMLWLTLAAMLAVAACELATRIASLWPVDIPAPAAER